MKELEKKGSAQIKKILLNHGAQEPFFGVKVGDLKMIQKKVKANHKLALELYNTGNSDAMYLAMLIAEPEKMTKKQLNDWVKKAKWSMISEYAVAWTAAESPHAWDLGLEWIKNKNIVVRCSGWSTLNSFIAITPDENLDLKKIESLIQYITKNIHFAPNRERYCMNMFLISVGGYIKDLNKLAIESAKKIGKVKVDVGDTSCKIPDAVPYIQKMIKHLAFKKKKHARC
jgi:3-methyladenine DNA glycosylase AlkD